MINHLAVLLALRSRLLTAEIAYTGVTTLTATGTGFIRGAGSFTADGFTVGMEVVPTGFADNTPEVIKKVTETEITLLEGRSTEPADAGRSLHVGIPTNRVWENKEATAETEPWRIEEDYLPGPSMRVTLGPQGDFEHQPMYVLRLYGPSKVGVTALYTVSGEILKTFPPQLAMSLPDSKWLRVRSDPAPFRGQVLPAAAGESAVVVTIPLVTRSVNPI